MVHSWDENQAPQGLRFFVRPACNKMQKQRFDL